MNNPQGFFFWTWKGLGGFEILVIWNLWGSSFFPSVSIGFENQVHKFWKFIHDHENLFECIVPQEGLAKAMFPNVVCECMCSMAIIYPK